VSALVLAVWIFSLVTFSFFLLYNLATLALTGLSLTEGAQQKAERGELFRPMRRPLRPGISMSCLRTTSGP
jgi:hypothetical protein